MTCPRTWARVPVWTNVNRCVNTSSSETPITISGVTSGNSMMKLDTPEPRPRQRARPSARSTPIGVAITTSSAASLRLCWSAWVRPGSLSTESGSYVYQRVEKPAQIVRERLSLNEYCTAISTGTIAHSMYAQVIRTRNRGRPHGLATQLRMRARAPGRAEVTAAAVMRAAPSLPGRP